VYKKPKAIAVSLSCKADKAEQEKFLGMIEAKLAENGRETAVYYADGTHPQHNTHCASLLSSTAQMVSAKSALRQDCARPAILIHFFQK